MTQQPHSVGTIPDINTLQIRLRAAREHAGYDQGELAERSGVSRGTISAGERGLRMPTRANLSLIAFATGVDAHWLKTGEMKEAPSPGGDGASAVRPEGFEPPTFWLGSVDARPGLSLVAA